MLWQDRDFYAHSENTSWICHNKLRSSFHAVAPQNRIIYSLLYSALKAILFFKRALELLLLNNQKRLQECQTSAECKFSFNSHLHKYHCRVRIVSKTKHWYYKLICCKAVLNFSMSELYRKGRYEFYLIISSFSPILNYWWATCVEEHSIKETDLQPQLAT